MRTHVHKQVEVQEAIVDARLLGKTPVKIEFSLLVQLRDSRLKMVQLAI